MDDMTPTPWQRHRCWPNGSQAACAYDDGSWSVRRPGTGRNFPEWGPEFETEDEFDVDRMGGRLDYARNRADEALSRLLAEMAAATTEPGIAGKE